METNTQQCSEISPLISSFGAHAVSKECIMVEILFDSFATRFGPFHYFPGRKRSKLSAHYYGLQQTMRSGSTEIKDCYRS